MSKLKDLSRNLPPRESDFIVDVEGTTSKKRYVGDFSCKIPDLKTQALIQKHKAFLNGELAQFLDFQTLKLHNMISYLRFTLSEYPKWWRESDLGYELLDLNVVEEVYNKVMDFETEWLKEIWGEEHIKKLEEESAEREGQEEPLEKAQ